MGVGRSRIIYPSKMTVRTVLGAVSAAVFRDASQPPEKLCLEFQYKVPHLPPEGVLSSNSTHPPILLYKVCQEQAITSDMAVTIPRDPQLSY